jgi:hypothetical protein
MKQKGLEEAFYVRLNNSTRPLGGGVPGAV